MTTDVAAETPGMNLNEGNPSEEEQVVGFEPIPEASQDEAVDVLQTFEVQTESEESPAEHIIETSMTQQTPPAIADLNAAIDDLSGADQPDIKEEDNQEPAADQETEKPEQISEEEPAKDDSAMVQPVTDVAETQVPADTQVTEEPAKVPAEEIPVEEENTENEGAVAEDAAPVSDTVDSVENPMQDTEIATTTDDEKDNTAENTSDADIIAEEETTEPTKEDTASEDLPNTETETDTEAENVLPEYKDGTLTASTEDGPITMSYTADAQIPEGAELIADTYDYDASSLEDENTVVASSRFYNVYIQKDNEKVIPAAEVEITPNFSALKDKLPKNGAMTLYSVAEDKLTAADSIKNPGVIGAVVTKPRRTYSDSVLTYTGEDFLIEIAYDKDAEIPDGTYLEVTEVPFEEYAQKAEEKLDKEVTAGRFFDIKMKYKGWLKTTDIMPNGDVQVSISLPADQTVSKDAKLEAIHFVDEDTVDILENKTENIEKPDSIADVTEEGAEEKEGLFKRGAKAFKGVFAAPKAEEEEFSITEKIPEEDSSENTEEIKWEKHTFVTESFSVYGVVYTYTINGETFEYDLPAGGFTNLENLIENLGVFTGTRYKTAAQFVSHVDMVESSAPEQLFVTRVENDTTAGDIRKELSLESFYYALLTEEEEIKLDSAVVKGGDWAIVGLLPIENEASLTVTLDNGAKFVISVTGKFEIEGVAETKKLARPRAIPKQTTSNENSEAEDLEHHKTLTPNTAENGQWDGTYTLSLDITGKKTSSESVSANKADIILVLDMSSSMIDNSVDGKTRFELEKEAVTEFGKKLLGLNNTKPDTIRMSIMTFGNMGQEPIIKGSTSASDFEDTISNLEAPHSGVGGLTSGGQATNWEDALDKAGDIETRADAKKIVIFVSDGQPTLRNTPDDPHSMESFMYRQIGAYGPGTDTPAGWWTDEAILKSVIEKCYKNAKDDAKNIVDAGKEFYTISVFEDVARMENLVAYAYSGDDSGTYPEGHYKTATNANALYGVFEGIFEAASDAIQYQNVKITDTLTVATKSTLQVDGHANDFKYYKNGVEWSDAPPASYNNRKVDWDLSSLGALEDGVTYTIAFTVWPNQDAYDAILKLNEGTATIEDIQRDYPDVAANLKKEDGKYTIYSNGDATVSYDKITTVNGEPQEPESKSLDYPRPTMKTLQYKMKVAKVWKDSLYANNRPDSIKFNIYEDGDFYKQVTLTSNNAVSDDRWEVEIPISPGIISNKIVSGDFKLNEGHDYTVEEALDEGETSDYHYDFDPETLRPMLDDGTMCFLGDDDRDQSLSGTNHMRGSMTVTKKVIDSEGKDISSEDSIANQDFKFKVYLKNSNGTEITGKTQDDEDAIWYRLLDETGTEIGSATIINSGEVITLKAGHSMRLLNLPRGLMYKVEEVEIPAEYDENYGITYSSISEDAGSNAVDLKPNEETGYCIAQPNTWQYVTVTNKKKPKGSIEITKKVTIDGNPTTGTDADGDYYFTISNVNTGEAAEGKVGENKLTDGIVKLTVSNGQAAEITITDVPAGEYYITEVEPGNGTALDNVKINNIDAEVETSGAVTVAVSTNEETTVVFTNNKSSLQIEKNQDYTVEKKWFNKDGNPLSGSDVANKTIKYRLIQKRAVVEGEDAIYPVVIQLLNFDGTINKTKTYYLKKGAFPYITAWKTDTSNVKATAIKYSGTYTKKQIKDPDRNNNYQRYVFTDLGSISRETLITIRPSSNSVKWSDVNLTSTYKADSPEKYIDELDKTSLVYTDYAEAEIRLSAVAEAVTFRLNDLTYIANNQNWTSLIQNLPLYKRDGNNFYVYKYEIAEIEVDGKSLDTNKYEVTYDTATFGKTIINNKIKEDAPELPSTGGPGTTLLTLIGFMLTGIAGAGFLMRKRRQIA